MPDKMRWGILGTGLIAKVFAEDLRHSRTARLSAVGSRDISRAEALASKYPGATGYGSYDEVLGDDKVDAVYISLPNHLHLHWIARAAEQRKHILCEKPLVLNADQASLAISAARENGVFLMEGFMYRVHPQIAHLVRLVREGAVGHVRWIEATFGFNMGSAFENIRLQNAAGGGAILDLGCYGVSIARLIAGAAVGRPYADPTQLKGFGHIGSTSGVDEWATATMLFDNGPIATVTCANQVNLPSRVHIWGDRGNAALTNPWFAGKDNAPGTVMLQRDNDTSPSPTVFQDDRPLYALEADAFCAAVLSGEASPPHMSIEDTRGNIRTLDMWRRELGLSFLGEGVIEK